MTTTVFIILLDILPGLQDALNHSSSSLDMTNTAYEICDQKTIEPLWQNIQHNYNLYQMFHEPYKKIKRLSPIENQVLNTKYSTQMKRTRIKLKTSAKIYSLVAIFETQSNLTAQTCSGILLSPHWVLTAASCVNLLGNFYKNSTLNGKSLYTIIANSTNPLVDGSVHNVTDIKLNTELIVSKSNIKRVPYLAMMRIKPPIEIQQIMLYKTKLEDNIYVTVFGWMLTKDGNDREVMRVNTFKARTVTSNKCVERNTDRYSVICLVPAPGTESKMAQMNSGGPVIVDSHGRYYLLGIIQSTTKTPLRAFSVIYHHQWIDSVMKPTS